MQPEQVRVLIVDDDPFSVALIGNAVREFGCAQVTECLSGEEASTLLAAPLEGFDLIVLDIKMPGMDGIEVIRRLVRYRYGGTLILVSGEDARILESVERLVVEHHLLCLGHLHKPLTRYGLFSLLAKLDGHVTRELPEAAVKPQFTKEELRAALAGRELINFYQPKVCLNSGALVGVECLVRWQHPLDGLLSPSRFIAQMEAHGLGRDLTHCVLNGALKQAAAWRRQGRPLAIAVNVSMDDLGFLDFPDLASLMADAAGVAPEWITFEVTEGGVMAHLTAILDVLGRLRLKGFKVAIDDFGTGNSTLAQLRDLPFTEIKIDRGFVHGAARSLAIRAICGASMSLARQMGLDTVAEGIEDLTDWEFVRSTQCAVGQGFFIARPMPGPDIPGWREQWEARFLEPLAAVSL